MGCDIHTYVEVKGNDNTWVDGNYYKRNRYFGEDENEKEFEVINIYKDRNYYLFSLLANVRNNAENEYISEPRGIPEDCCKAIKEESDSWDCDGHSHSYLTLKEIMDFAENHKIIKYKGYVSPEGAKKIENGEMPEEWCGWTSIKDWVYKEWEYESNVFEGLIFALKQRAKDLLWCFSEQSIIENSEKIRLVFWFDN